MAFAVVDSANANVWFIVTAVLVVIESLFDRLDDLADSSEVDLQILGDLALVVFGIEHFHDRALCVVGTALDDLRHQRWAAAVFDVEVCREPIHKRSVDLAAVSFSEFLAAAWDRKLIAKFVDGIRDRPLRRLHQVGVVDWFA